MNDLKIPYNVFIDQEWILKNTFLEENGDDLHLRLMKAKEIAIKERDDKNELYIVIEHDFNANCFLMLNYDYLMSIKNGNLKIYATNKKSVGIVIGKAGRNVNSLKNKINLKLADFNGLEESGFPKRHIRNFTIIDIEKKLLADNGN